MKKRRGIEIVLGPLIKGQIEIVPILADGPMVSPPMGAPWTHGRSCSSDRLSYRRMGSLQSLLRCTSRDLVGCCCSCLIRIFNE